MIVNSLIEKLISKKLTVSIAESMTGGYISHKLTEVEGSSKAFKGSIVSYSKDSKINLLKVDKSIIENYGIVSKEVSSAMYIGLKRLFESDIYITITGNAGPTCETNTHSFECYITIAYNENIYEYCLNFNDNNRLKNIKKSTNFIFEKLLNII